MHVSGSHGKKRPDRNGRYADQRSEQETLQASAVGGDTDIAQRDSIQPHENDRQDEYAATRSQTGYQFSPEWRPARNERRHDSQRHCAEDYEDERGENDTPPRHRHANVIPLIPACSHAHIHNWSVNPTVPS